MTEHEAKLKKAGQFLEQGKHLHAAQIYNSLLNDPLTRREAVVKLTEIYDKQNQFDAAIKNFETYFEVVPHDENMRTYYAQFLIRYDKYNDAMEVLSHVSSKSQPEKNLLIGTINFYLGEYEIAVLNFSEFVNRNKDSEFVPEAYHNLSRCYIKLKEFDKALEYLKLCEEIERNNFNVLKSYAIVYFEKEMYFHANEKIQKAIKIFPIDPELFQISARIYLQLNEPEKALKELSIYLQNTKPTTESYILEGLIFQKMNDFDEAIKYFDKALELDSANETATNGKNECINSRKKMGG